MFKQCLPVLLLAVMPCAFAQPVPDIQPDTTPNITALSQENPLTAQEAAGVALAKKWINGTSKPVTAGDGSVTYFFGKSQPVIVCAPLQICDLALEPGERINKNGLNIGDSTRWGVTPSLSGEGDTQITNLIIKPADVGLVTSLVINTDRRTYSIRLVSRNKDWMPLVNFDYPEALKKSWDDFYATRAADRQAKTLGNGLNIDNLDFEYRIEGDAPFRPVRVYNNGIKTFIELPRSVASGELPAVMVVNPGTGEKEVVNYGWSNGKFIVDQLARQIVLVIGVGRQQQSVLISRSRQ